MPINGVKWRFLGLNEKRCKRTYYIYIYRKSTYCKKVFFTKKQTLGALPPNPQQEHRPCTRILLAVGQEERKKTTSVLSDRIIWLLRSVKVIRSGIPPPTGEHILTLPLTALCNCNVHYINSGI